MADLDDSAVFILRRIEPALTGIVAELRDMRKDITDVRVAVATKPGRAELWAAIATLITLFAVIMTGLAVVLPKLH